MDPRRILLVDDESDIRLIAKMELEAHGFLVESCESGQEALEKAKGFHPDLILLDVTMPAMDGPTLLGELRKIPGIEYVPVIFMTASTLPHQISRYREMNAEVIGKPFCLETFSSTIQEIFSRLVGLGGPGGPAREGKHEAGNFVPPSPFDGEDERQNFRKKADAIRQNYIAKLPDRILRIEESWKKMAEGNWNKAVLIELQHAVHQITGSGATFGLPIVSATARTLEIFLQTIVETGIVPTSSHRDQIGKYLKLLKRSSLESACATDALSHCASFSSAKLVEQRNRMVFIVDDDEALARNLELYIRQAGYRTRVFTSLSEVKAVLSEVPPDVVIMDIHFPDGSGTRMVSEIQQSRPIPLPIVFISSKDDLSTRLQTVRAGGFAYFSKPIDMEPLVEKLDELTGSKTFDPHRVLIVDDDEALASYYGAALENIGMEVSLIHDPMKVIDLLSSLKPDLILMDISMPECNGIELAAVIRQEAQYAALPIIFLTAEQNPQKKIEAMLVGADDFLHKPISPEELVLAVTNRLQKLEIWEQKENRRKKQMERSQVLLRQKLAQEKKLRKEAERRKSQLEEKVQTMEEEMVTAHQLFSGGELQPGTSLLGSEGESYEISQLLGHGGMGVTYHAIRNSDKKKVAIKTLLPEAMSDVKILMRFVQEARILMSLDHQNLVRGLDLYQGRNFCYFVMEFIDGTSVEEMMESGPVELEKATRIVLGIAKGLGYLEENHMVHRDIKPSNIILSKDEVPKLVDFGIVKITDRPCALTTPSVVLGTPFYIAPEQIYQSNVDIRSDIYSLGATYYHMVTGQLPFQGENVIDVLHQRLRRSPKPSQERPDLPQEICRIIEKMMHPKKERRYQHVVELIDELEMSM